VKSKREGKGRKEKIKWKERGEEGNLPSLKFRSGYATGGGGSSSGSCSSSSGGRDAAFCS